VTNAKLNIVSNIVAIKAFFMWHNSICTNTLTIFRWFYTIIT